MFRHNLKLSWRILRRNKVFASVNILGLALGMMIAMFIALWVRDELSFDKFHASRDRIYQVNRHVYSGDQIRTSNSVTYNIASTLRSEYPEVEQVAVTTNPMSFVFHDEDVTIRQQGLCVEPSFFEIFSWDLLLGTPGDLLDNPSSIVISSSLAARYFGPNWQNEGIIGKTVECNSEFLDDLQVSGVFGEVPKNSSLQFDFLLPMEIFVSQNDWLHNWMNSGIAIYLTVREGIDVVALNSKIIDVQNQHIEGFRSDLFLRKYSDQHLYSNFKDGVLTGGRIDYVRIFVIIALIVVLIACINFANLSTARSMKRIREIGIRKVVGADRRILIGQFMGESLMLVFLSFVISLIGVILAMPFFNLLVGKELMIGHMAGGTWLLFLGIGIITAILAGTYPAIYLSSFGIINILRGTFQPGKGGRNLKKGLIVFQFAMSIVLIASTLTVYKQIDYIQSKNLGLNRENVIYIPSEGKMDSEFKLARSHLLQEPGIQYVSTSNSSPLDVGSNTHSVQWSGKDPNSQISMNILGVNYDFLNVMKMELVDGRDFDRVMKLDSSNYIINEKAAEVMGFESPLGEELSFWNNSGKVIGVVKDFHMTSLYSEISPTIMMLRPNWSSHMYLRTNPGQTKEAIASLEKVFKRFNPDFPLEYQFMDERFNAMYKSEQVMGKLSIIFAGTAVFIAFLGLLGLAVFAGQQRLKEVSIRKVLGAKVAQIVYLLCKEFVYLVLIAFLIATPLTYVFASDWLEKYSYKINLGAGVFILAGGTTLFIALCTVGFYSLKIAFSNPVNNLRSE